MITRLFNALYIKELLEKKIQKHHAKYEEEVNSHEYGLNNWEVTLQWYSHHLEQQEIEIDSIKKNYTNHELDMILREYDDQFKEIFEGE